LNLKKIVGGRDRLKQSLTTDGTNEMIDELNDSSMYGGIISFNRFKNTTGASATQQVRKSLNEITQQIKKTKEFNELMVERKNIEKMIVNSKLWSPPFSGNNLEMSNNFSKYSTDLNQPYTTNVFRDKREELTKILKKRLNYIHVQS
jgi:23S rRNA G2069 N7-methylase RlmK/C1962 C5-methylase RlmI